MDWWHVASSAAALFGAIYWIADSLPQHNARPAIALLKLAIGIGASIAFVWGMMGK